ncbi:hypothetical protein [Planococcus beigongshangi]|uniref:hypothetical protein n=1 Tax=Planococcus beigongshangi TaxID=2782536 RepID=UPI001EEEFFBC|nr:hypothetical protein [Planococcus beigongshangi]
MKKQTQKTVWTQVVKTGIIKSNLIPMAARIDPAVHCFAFSILARVLRRVFRITMLHHLEYRSWQYFRAKRTYLQSNIYLVLLVLSGFLFLPLSLFRPP